MRGEDRYKISVRGGRTYLAGLGSSGSLLAGAAALFILASAIVAFRGWPQIGAAPATSNVSASPVAVASRATRRLNAVITAARSRIGVHGATAGSGRSRGGTRTGVKGVSSVGSPTAPSSSSGSSGGVGGSPTAAAGSQCGSGCGSGPTPQNPVTRLTDRIVQTVSTVGDNVGNQVSGITGTVGSQVGKVNQPAGNTIQSVGSTVGNTVTQTANSASSVITTVVGGGGH